MRSNWWRRWSRWNPASSTRKVGENEHLFGSVTSSDIAHALEQKGYPIDRRKVQLDEPLKQLGEFPYSRRLHCEVSAHIKVTVSAEADSEAEPSVPSSRGHAALRRVPFFHALTLTFTSLSLHILHSASSDPA